MGVPVIADIVGSRKLDDRAAAQADLEAAIARVETDMPMAVRMLGPTVGDELQGVYPGLESALAALLLIRLALPDGIDCRFGVGVGEIGVVPSASIGAIAEGPGWWAAREAIDHVHGLQSRAVPAARTWIVADAAEAAATHDVVRATNAYVLSRDQLVGSMSARVRRLTYGRILGVTQRELADAEGVSQSAVSQALAASGGGALVEGLRVLGGGE